MLSESNKMGYLLFYCSNEWQSDTLFPPDQCHVHLVTAQSFLGFSYLKWQDMPLSIKHNQFTLTTYTHPPCCHTQTKLQGEVSPPQSLPYPSVGKMQNGPKINVRGNFTLLPEVTGGMQMRHHTHLLNLHRHTQMTISVHLLDYSTLLSVLCPVSGGMAQMRKSGCDGIRTNSRAELRVPQVSARQEILTSLVSALDSVVGPLAHLHIRY